MNIKILTQSVFRFFIVVVVLLVSAHIIQISLYHLDVSHYVKFIDLDIENNLPSFYSSMAIEFCAVLLAIIFLYKRQNQKKESWYWLGLALIFMFLGFDEATQIHEELSDIFEDSEVIDASGVLYFAWVIPYGVLTAIVGLLYWSWLWKLPAITRKNFIIAGLTFITGAIGAEMISAIYADEYSVYDWRYSIAYTIEETLEMSGIVLFIRALLQYIEQNIKLLTLDFSEPFEDESMIHPVLSDATTSISELKKNPMAVVEQGEGFPVAVFDRNQAAFYCVPAEAYGALMDKLENMELAALVDARRDQDEVEINIDDL